MTEHRHARKDSFLPKEQVLLFESRREFGVERCCFLFLIFDFSQLLDVGLDDRDEFAYLHSMPLTLTVATARVANRRNSAKKFFALTSVCRHSA